MRRRLSLLAMWFGVALGAAPAARAAPSGAGFSDFDPDREVIVLGRVRPGDAGRSPDATTEGAWSLVDGRLSAPAPAGAERLFFPVGKDAHFRDGLVRLRMEPGAAPDLGVMLRVRWPKGRVRELSGYALALEGDEVRFYRFDGGRALPQGPAHKLARDKKRRSIEIVVLLVGPQIFASVYDGESLAHLGTLAMHDTTHRAGCVGLRAGPTQAADAAVTLLSVMDAARAAAIPSPVGPRYGHDAAPGTTPFGNTRYALVSAAGLARLPADLRRRVVARPDDRAVLALDTVELERLRRSDVAPISVDSNVPWGLLDRAFRARAEKAPTPTARGLRIDESYKDPRLVEAVLRGYAERYPELARVHELGRSHQGRPILALEISARAGAAESEPAVLMTGAHHGSELLSTEYVLDAVQTLLEGHRGDRRVRRWLEHLSIWCVPLVNPDGNFGFVHVSRFFARKNGRDVDADGRTDPWEGVDLNRNYPVGFGGAGSSDVPMDRDYRGPGPASEPETRALVELAQRQRFSLALSFHTLGTYVLSPYVGEGLADLSPDVPRTVGDALAASAPEQPNGRTFRVRPPEYPVSGSDQDFHLHCCGTLAYVIEGSHHNPPLELRAASVAATRPLWEAALDRVLDGAWIAGHVRDEMGAPVEAAVHVAEIQRRAGEVWTARPHDGWFDRAVAGPGRYTLQVDAPGYERAELPVRVGTRRATVEVVLRRRS